MADKINILISGGSRGIGLAAARKLAPRANCLLLTARNQSELDAAASAIATECPVKVRTLSCDQADAQTPAAIGKWANAQVDCLDLLVLNAGSYVEGSLADISESDFRRTLEINFFSNHLIARELIPLVAKSTLKRIVVIGSVAAYGPYPLVPSYGVSKWALRGLVSNLEVELRSLKIGLTLISPGATWTTMWEGEDLPREALLESTDVAEVVSMVLALSPQAVLREVIIEPISGEPSV